MISNFLNICYIRECYSLDVPYDLEYMIPRSKWDESVKTDLFDLNEQFGSQFGNHERKVANYMAYYQFCFTEKIVSNCKIPFKLIQRIEDGYLNVRDISTPHMDLDYVFHIYEKARFLPIPEDIKEYEKSKASYENILSVEEDEEKWIEALKKAGDDLFVQQNIEFRIGREMRNKKLWKLYIEYLKEHNSNILLHTYSKYCRFWLDDLDMRIEYENQVKIHAPIKVPWTNLFIPSEKFTFLQSFRNMIFGIRPPQFQPKPFEIHGSIEGTFCDLNIPRYYQNEKNLNFGPRKFGIPRLRRFYSKEGLIYQKFPYCSTMINFMLKNAKAGLLQKLFKSCKEFYARQATPVCYKLTLQQDTYYPPNPIVTYKESLIISHENPASIYSCQNLVIQKRLWISSSKFSKMLSMFIPKIHRCDAKFIEIYRQNLSKNEFEFLTKNGTVVELILYKVQILDENDDRLPFEDIMKMVVSSIRMIEISNINLYTPQTARILSELPFKNKIQRLFLWNINVELDTVAFSKFIEKNAAANCKLKIRFIQSPNFDEFKNLFFKRIHETISKKWKHEYFRPICIPEKSPFPSAPIEKAPFYDSDPMWPQGI